MTNEELGKIIDRRNTLFARIDVLSTMDGDPTIQAIKLEYAEEMTRLDKVINEKREYMYNFVRGGWNTEHARTVEEAIAQAKARWANPQTLSFTTNIEVDEKTFRVTNEQELRSALSLGLLHERGLQRP